MIRYAVRIVVGVLLGLLTLVTTGVYSDEGEKLFEEKIRPILVRHCYECHSAQSKNLQGGLRLDTRDGVRRGGESGAVVEPGKPDASLLMQALRYESLEMPPAGKLPAAVIADFARWVALGAPDPRPAGNAPTANAAVSKTATPVIDFAAARRHWAYRPLEKSTPPLVRDSHWPRSPIDRFVLVGLEGAGLSPSPPSDRRTLIRRVYFDLLGLPPTYEEIEQFAQDDAPDAYHRLLDRLLASPSYGERWARHWLDVARYADTKDGVLMFGADRVRPYAYTYRDYVVRALNVDTRFSQFVTEQLAADQIEPPVEPWRLAAMGFLTLGRMYDNNLPDIYDDRIDTISRGLLGLTVTCARCHDHKYDAIDQADYYALYGVMASSEAPLEAPLAADPSTAPGFADFEAKAEPIRQKLREHIDSQFQELSTTARQRVGDYLERVVTTKPDPLETAVFFLSLSPEDLRPTLVARWRRLFAQRSRSDDPVFGPWHELLAIPDEKPGAFASQAPSVVARWLQVPSGTAAGQLNPLVRDMLAGVKLTDRAAVAQAYGGLLRSVWEEARNLAPTELPAPGTSRRQIVDLMVGEESPFHFLKSQTYLYMARVPRMTFHQLQNDLDKLAVNTPTAPPRAMVLIDSPTPHDPRIFVRGNPAQPGDRVARRFLRVLAGDQPAQFTHGGGRLDLARAIIAPSNPLAARVFANRVWMHHWGEPLVASPSDFGARTAPPTHPELLDWLAGQLTDSDDGGEKTFGGSLKRLHREILASQTYRQASVDRQECRRVDPDNRLLWRANRRRLDFEGMRDALLARAERLDRTLFGRPVNLVAEPANPRRTIYGLVDRQDLPGMYRAFDFASPDQSTDRRPLTTTPQQALFAMNSAFVLIQAKALAARPEIVGEASPARRVESLYRAALARAPTADEVTAAVGFVSAPPATGDQLSAWEQLAQVLLETNELMFVD